MDNITYDGILYQIEYQKHLSRPNYTEIRTYYIKTEDKSYSHAEKAITSIMETQLHYRQGEIWSRETWKNKPSTLSNALHVYYEFSYSEDLDVYVYTFVRPYDD